MQFAKSAKLRLERVSDTFRWIANRNQPYISYYRSIMRRDAQRDYKEAIGGEWDKLGKIQLERLVMHGMQPHHMLLDMGCGSLRGGRFLIPILMKETISAPTSALKSSMPHETTWLRGI
jgi:hypothetical protein